MRITRQQLNKLLEGIATAHYQIHTYGWGDVPDLLAREDIIYPFMMVTPQASVYGDNTINHTYTISIADRVLKDKENEVAVDSDTHEILMHVVTQLDNLLYDDVDLIKGVSVTPFFDNFRHEVTGHFGNVTVQVMYNYDACAVPSDNVPLPIPPPSDCADATYRVQYENGTLIQEGTIPSGGSIVVDVPNIVPCADATWELRDSDGVLLDSGSIASGGSATITAPDGAVTITDSDGATLYVVNVTSGGAETQAIGDSSVEVRNSLNAVVDSGVVKAQGSGVFNAPDANVTVNGDGSFGTIPSDGSKNILVENTDGAPVGAFDGNSNSWVVADSTVNVRKSDATLIQAVTVAAEDTESVNVADSVAVLKDTAANVISSTNIKATESEDVTAPDGSLQNSDASATLTVRSGEANKPIADVNIEVNTVVEGQVPALKDVKILITDGVNPVTPDDVSVVGDTVTVEVPSGGGAVDLDYFDKFGNETNNFTITANTVFEWKKFNTAPLFLSRLTSPSSAIIQAITEFVEDCIVGGIWEDMYDIRPMVTTDNTEFVLNLKYPFLNESGGLGSIVGSPSISVNGVTTNGINNGIIFPCSMDNFNNGEMALSVYNRTDGADANTASIVIGYGQELNNRRTGIAIRTSTDQSAIYHRPPTNAIYALDTAYTGSALGLWSMTKDSIGNYKVCRNGAEMTNYTYTNANATSTNTRIGAYAIGGFYISRLNAIQFGSGFASSREISYTCAHAFWDETKELIHYNAVQKMQTTLNRNV
jgi:hypothetical protein